VPLRDMPAQWLYLLPSHPLYSALISAVLWNKIN
jgi:hypothetical protein